MRIVAILLAAGAGVRFGGGKLLAKLPDGAIVGARACANLIEVIPHVIAVVRPGDDALAQQFADAGATVTFCDDASAGMGASLAHGVRFAIDADAVLVALADMPWIRPQTLVMVADALRDGEPLVAPRCQGQRGHPVGFGSVHFPALIDLHDDQGARDVIAGAAHIRLLDVDDPGVVRDVDTPADLRTESHR